MFNQDSYLVKFWAEKKFYENMPIPNLFNLQAEVNTYIQNVLQTPTVEEPVEEPPAEEPPEQTI